ncbi:MAG: hypothetical protein DWP95_00435, partial [Proteobacteria bacterium]
DNKHFNLAKAFLAISIINHDQKQAAVLLNELIETKQQSPELMAATAMLAFKQKQFDEAADYLINVCRSSMAYPSWFITLSQTLVAMNRLEEAKQVLHRLLERGQNDRAVVMLAMIEIRQDNYKQAIERLKNIETDSPHHRVALKQRMLAHHQSQQWTQALSLADELLGINPANSEAVVVKAYAQTHLAQPKQAIETLKKALADKDLEDRANDINLYTGLLLDAEGDYDTAWKYFSAQQHDEPKSVSMLDKNAEKTVQKWPTAAIEQQPVFVFSDTATGHVNFMQRLAHHGIATLTDRYQRSGRQDLFTRAWDFKDIAELTDARCHLLRKKYRQHLKLRHEDGAYADFVPMTALHMALIKKVFPAAAVIVLDRNMPDRHLHQKVFANSHYSATDFHSLKNQLIAMNPNIYLLDIDALMANDQPILDKLSQLFATKITPWDAPDVMPMEQLMLPKNRWKNYREYLQTIKP